MMHMMGKEVITAVRQRGRVAIKKSAQKYWILLATLLLILTADQASKALVIRSLPENETIPLVHGYLNIIHVQNQGAAFGILSSGGAWIQRYFFIPISVVASLVILIIVVRAREDELLKIVSISLVMSGALGNLMDRLRWGAVVDFIDIHYGTLHWPAFNVADASISVGVILLISHLMFDCEA